MKNDELQFYDECFKQPVKRGTMVWTKEAGAGIFLYPHELKKDENTICSVYSKDKKRIFHLPASSLENYTNVCWKCGTSLNSNKDETCVVCHRLVCPSCGSCSPDCKEDEIIVIDNICDFSDKYSELYEQWMFEEEDTDCYNGFYYVGTEEIDQMENYLAELIKNNIPIIIYQDDIGMIELYIKEEEKNKAINILSHIKANLMESFDDVIDGLYRRCFREDKIVKIIDSENSSQWVFGETEEEFWEHIN